MFGPVLRASMIVAAIGMGIISMASRSAVAENTEPDRAALAAAMGSARSTLEEGLQSSEQKGRPISAKFEIDDGHLQLSIYTEHGNEFTEVVIDPLTGAITQAEAITDPDDLTAARTQKAAVANASVSLLSATQRAVNANAGFRAVRILPELQAGHPVARVTLFRSDDFRTVVEKLD